MSKPIPRRRARRRALSSNGILYPLDVVYQRGGVALPKARRISSADIPLLYRSLLVHDTDMTQTLETHFGESVALRVLSTFFSGRSYFRRVLLVSQLSGRPVEMGAIRIRLDVFSSKIRAQILGNAVPLGRLLRDGGVDFESRPKLYVAVTPNSEMMGVFWMPEPRTLYGRQTEVIHRGAKIGDIVEILPTILSADPLSS